MGGAGGGKTGPNVEGEASQSEHSAATAKPGTCLVSIGPGLPSLPKRLVERIGTGEYVDFGELPPAKGKSRPLPQAGEGQVVVVQATDLMAGHPEDDSGLGYLAAVLRHIYGSGGKVKHLFIKTINPQFNPGDRHFILFVPVLFLERQNILNDVTIK